MFLTMLASQSVVEVDNKERIANAGDRTRDGVHLHRMHGHSHGDGGGMNKPLNIFNLVIFMVHK